MNRWNKRREAGRVRVRLKGRGVSRVIVTDRDRKLKSRTGKEGEEGTTLETPPQQDKERQDPVKIKQRRRGIRKAVRAADLRRPLAPPSACAGERASVCGLMPSGRQVGESGSALLHTVDIRKAGANVRQNDSTD